MNVAFRDYLRPGEDRIIRHVTETSGVFYPDEIDIAEELARENLRLGADRSGYHYILAEVEGEIAGYTCYGPTPCTKFSYDLYWIAVDQKFKSAGLGMRLMALTEEKVLASGGRKVYAETSSRDPYIPARRFYTKCGFQEVAVIKDFYDFGDHKVMYVKDLFQGEV
jgi:ribosomal protein S18 acetylase RimI-like enzyme